MAHMQRLRVTGSALVAVLAMVAVAASAASAQTRSRQSTLRGSPHALARPNYGPKHKGGKGYEICTRSIGTSGFACGPQFVVYAKADSWEVEGQASLRGTIESVKEGKKKYTVFRGPETGCSLTAAKTKTGYGSEAAPGTVSCDGSLIGEWYAHK
jgi:hypothetical protein